MAEIEFSVFSRQCLSCRIGDEAALKREVSALERERNRAYAVIDWRFSTQDARTNSNIYTHHNYMDTLLGLTPRVRGSLLALRTKPGIPRSIPACAGQPGRFRQYRRPHGVYPRVGGAAGLTYTVHTNQQGLSPRVRGSLGRGCRALQHTGSIPACAGQPASTACSTCSRAVYPRVCGAALAEGAGHCSIQGLSPRVRGSRRGVAVQGQPGGSIPACAGQPGSSS